MLVTMFTDASWCPETGAGGWAVWWKFDGYMERKAGGFKNPPASSFEAELGALVNGLWLLDRWRPKPWLQGGMIIQQSDCLAALDSLRSTVPNPSRSVQAMRQAWHDLKRDRGWRTDLRYVKAHVGRGDRETTQGKRTAVNWWCDKAAKEAMQCQRQQLRQV